jgi:endonuclease YncB( thermonuclease family)
MECVEVIGSMRVLKALVVGVLITACGPGGQFLPPINDNGGESDGGAPMCATDNDCAQGFTCCSATSSLAGECVETIGSCEMEPPPDDWLVEDSGLCDLPENQVYVRKIKDGDTIMLKQLVDGSDTVRYIGVDAAELFKDECWSKEAQQALADLTPAGKPVCLVADSEEETKDMYGRLLRYVYMHDGERWVQQNARLVRVGAARAYHKFLKGMDYQWEILDAENKAYKDKLGGWSDCGW